MDIEPLIKVGKPDIAEEVDENDDPVSSTKEGRGVKPIHIEPHPDQIIEQENDCHIEKFYESDQKSVLVFCLSVP